MCGKAWRDQHAPSNQRIPCIFCFACSDCWSCRGAQQHCAQNRNTRSLLIFSKPVSHTITLCICLDLNCCALSCQLSVVILIPLYEYSSSPSFSFRVGRSDICWNKCLPVSRARPHPTSAAPTFVVLLNSSFSTHLASCSPNLPPISLLTEGHLCSPNLDR